jgi:hypothetical protein
MNDVPNSKKPLLATSPVAECASIALGSDRSPQANPDYFTRRRKVRRGRINPETAVGKPPILANKGIGFETIESSFTQSVNGSFDRNFSSVRISGDERGLAVKLPRFLGFTDRSLRSLRLCVKPSESEFSPRSTEFTEDQVELELCVLCASVRNLALLPHVHRSRSSLRSLRFLLFKNPNGSGLSHQRSSTQSAVKSGLRSNLPNEMRAAEQPAEFRNRTENLTVSANPKTETFLRLFPLRLSCVSW